MSSLIGLDIAGDESVKSKVREFGDIMAGYGVEVATEWMVEIERQYAPSHKGEPFQWSSDRQRRAAFAKMREQGGPPYSRTQTLARGWHTLGSGINMIGVNEVPYAQYVKDPPIPGHAAREWKSVTQDLKEKRDRLVEKFSEGVRKAKNKVGL